MAKLDKRLLKIVNKMAESSFNEKGQLQEKRVAVSVKTLKNLTRPLAIAALSLYLKRIKGGLLKTTLQIESAVSLSKKQVNNLVISVGKKQPVFTVTTHVKDSLLGGLRVKIGDVVFDDSLAQKIAQLKGVIHG